MINDEAVDMTWKLDYLEILLSLIVDYQSNTLLNKMSQLQFF